MRVLNVATWVAHTCMCQRPRVSETCSRPLSGEGVRLTEARSPWMSIDAPKRSKRKGRRSRRRGTENKAEQSLRLTLSLRTPDLT